MRIPVIRGTIDRRVLVNFRVVPDVLADLLPRPFRPKVVNEFGMAGICLIRLKHIRPRMLPAALGLTSENAAHRIAVEWEQDGALHEGVYIPRRDTSSRLNALVGGRIFPGMHHHARFDVDEHEGRYRIAIDSADRQMHVALEGEASFDWPKSSVFGSREEASNFFQRGSLGYSATSHPDRFDGLELRTFEWEVQPFAVERIESSFFEDFRLFPAGSVQLDCALLMRGVQHEWLGRPQCCAA